MSQGRGASSLKRKRPGVDGKDKDLSADERMVLDVIRSKGDMGIWKGDLKKELNLANTKMVDNCIKSLLLKLKIKEVVNIKSKGKNRLMAVEFEPSTDLTGGLWYDNGNLDKDLIVSLKRLIKRNISHQKVATADGLCHVVKKSGMFSVTFSLEQIKEILDNMILEKEILKEKSNEIRKCLEEQSVVGRKRIYYDQDEALICSDSEDDIAEVEEEQCEFSEGEDQILRMAFQGHGSDEDVVDVVSHFIGGTPKEIQDRYSELKLKLEKTPEQDSTEKSTFLKKSLSAALDSVDTLFCRCCLVFDCRLHGCSQTIVQPSEKQSSWSEPEDRKPCSDQCYLLVRQTAEKLVEASEGDAFDENVASDEAGIVQSLGSAAVDGSNVGVLSAAITGEPPCKCGKAQDH